MSGRKRKRKNVIEITNEIYFAHSANDVASDKFLHFGCLLEMHAKETSNDVRLKVVSFLFIFINFICSFLFRLLNFIFLDDEKRMNYTNRKNG